MIVILMTLYITMGKFTSILSMGPIFKKRINLLHLREEDKEIPSYLKIRLKDWEKQANHRSKNVVMNLQFYQGLIKGQKT